MKLDFRNIAQLVESGTIPSPIAPSKLEAEQRYARRKKPGRDRHPSSM